MADLCSLHLADPKKVGCVCVCVVSTLKSVCPDPVKFLGAPLRTSWDVLKKYTYPGVTTSLDKGYRTTRFQWDRGDGNRRTKERRRGSR